MHFVKNPLRHTALTLSLMAAFASTALPVSAQANTFTAQAQAQEQPLESELSSDEPSDAVAPTVEVTVDEIAPETRAKIEELLEITNASELNAQIMEGIITQFRQAALDVPDEWWDRFIAKVDFDELNELVIPIYARNFTDEELDGIIDFYRTPVGQSVLAKMPTVVEESLGIGQQWGIGLAQEVLDELADDGYDVSI